MSRQHHSADRQCSPRPTGFWQPVVTQERPAHRQFLSTLWALVILGGLAFRLLWWYYGRP